LKELERGGRPKKTWWDCDKDDDMESLGLSQEDAQFGNSWRSITGQLANCSNGKGKVNHAPQESILGVLISPRP